jgi:hypothetical protein
MDVPCPSPIPNATAQNLPIIDENTHDGPERRTGFDAQFTGLYSLLRVINTIYRYDLK